MKTKEHKNNESFITYYVPIKNNEWKEKEIGDKLTFGGRMLE